MQHNRPKQQRLLMTLASDNKMGLLDQSQPPHKAANKKNKTYYKMTRKKTRRH